MIRLFDRVQSGIMQLNDGSYTIEQVIEDAEAWGFRLKWGVNKKNRKYVTDICLFEEEI